MKEINPKQLMDWLSGRREVVVFITGPTGAGKSTLVGNIGARLHYQTVFPGKAVRRRPDLLTKVANSKSPTAPAVTEAFVRDYVRKKAGQAEGRSLAIDGLPRAVEQVTFCLDLALDFEKTPVFIYLDADRDERVRRLTQRGDVGDKELVAKRLISDEAALPSVMSRIAQAVFGGRFGYFFIVNSGGVCGERQIITPVEGEPFGFGGHEGRIS